jgi:putative ABC transport system substrate-binding protein
MIASMRRREFITFLGGVAAAWPLAASAQQPAMPVVGFLSSNSPEVIVGAVAEFRRGVKEAGYVEGKNVAIEFRWGNGQFARLPPLAADLVRRQVAVIVAEGASPAAFAAKAATSTIPIIIAGGADPVKNGLVVSLNRPGGNVTGITYLHNELAGKRLDLLLKMVPQATTVGYLVGSGLDEMEQEYTSDLLNAARALGREIIILECRGPGDFDAAFGTVVQRQEVGALVVSAFPLAFNNRGRILALAARHKIPAIYPQAPYAFGGGLMSYSAVGTLHQIGFFYVSQILKGAKPADLPVQQPTKFHLIINLKTAKALGLDVPPQLLAIADAVIE